ncbi:MAG: helicase HerA-like domain-containing protein [Puniceicoccaceae bacterium]
MDEFERTLVSGYSFAGPALQIGAGIEGDAVRSSCPVAIPLKTLNRHGLIAGATGTGKTVTLQVVAEQLSLAGVPTLLMDIKGDLSGIGASGKENAKILERHERIGIPFSAGAAPVEFLTLSNEPGSRLRATVTEFGPVLLAKILGLNDTQEGVLAVLFRYCDDRELPLIDLEDLRRALQWITGDGKDDFEELCGRVSTASVGAIVRKIIGLEQQGADLFFGEMSFEVEDLLRFDDEGRGIASIIRLADLQDRPKLFSTFMLCLLAEIYSTFPEAGDQEKPKLVLFIDEAHLVFSNATKALLEQVEAIVKLIRSKGVGLIFVTQNPTDIPDSVLGQLGLKIQHALRAFTAKDRRAIKLAAENFPESSFYKVSEVLTQMGIGEALVTCLNEKGIPTPLARTYLRAPGSRIGPLSEEEVKALVARSGIQEKYNARIDRDSAAQILGEKMARAREAEEQERLLAEQRAYESTRTAPRTQSQRGRAPSAPRTPRTSKRGTGMVESMTKNTMVRQMGRSFMREFARGILGVLGVGRKRR